MKLKTNKAKALYAKHPELRMNCGLMYKYYSSLQTFLKPVCVNDHGHWDNNSKRNLKRKLKDLWDKWNMINACDCSGRSPYSNFNAYISMMWEEVDKGNMMMFNNALSNVPTI